MIRKLLQTVGKSFFSNHLYKLKHTGLLSFYSCEIDEIFIDRCVLFGYIYIYLDLFSHVTLSQSFKDILGPLD